MKLLLVYAPEDIEKNRAFIAMYERECAARGIEFELADHPHPALRATFPLKGGRLRQTENRPLSCLVVNRSRDFSLSERLEQRGIRVCNNSIVARLGNDKAASQEYMEALGVPMMRRVHEPQEGDFPLVMKSVDGHGGSEVFIVNNASEIYDVQSRFPDKQFIFQKLCDTPGRDKRVYIVGNRVIAAMLRENPEDFRSNYSLGGKATLSSLNAEEHKIVNSILDKLSIDMAGIDLIYHKGKPVFNELEDVVGCRMLYRYTDIDIVKEFFRCVFDVESQQF